MRASPALSKKLSRNNAYRGRPLFFQEECPKHFRVSDTIVRLEEHRENIKGFIISTGEPYPPAKAIVDGSEIENPEILPSSYRL